MKLLMCRPDFYGVEYEINPWMDRRRAPDREKARQQWQELYETLHGLGAHIELIEPAPRQPDMVFTANAGLVVGGRVILSNFRHKERQGETPYFRRWFESRGYAVETLPAEHPFEGEGDALFCGGKLFAGYLYRSDVFSHRLLSERLGVEVLSLQLTDPRYYHLDTCFCPLRAGLAAYYPAAFDVYAQKVLSENITELIEISEADAARFAANAVVLGNAVVLNAGSAKFSDSLRGHGREVFEVDLSQFLRAGGAAKCLILQLD